MAAKKSLWSMVAASCFAAWGIAALVQARYVLAEALGWDTTWMLALVCGGSAAVCFGIAALLLNHRTRARHAGWLLGLAYLLCWFTTATWGARDLEPADAASFAEQFGLPTSNDLVRLERLPDLSIRPETPHVPESISSGRRGVFLAAARLPLTPFLVRLDYAYLVGPLQGEAGRESHVWLFGYRSRAAAKVFWVA